MLLRRRMLSKERRRALFGFRLPPSGEAKAVREQTRHGLLEQKLVNAQSTKQQSQHMLLQKKEREAVRSL